MTDDYVVIPGSEVKPPGLRRMQAADPSEAVEATIVIRRPAAARMLAPHSGKSRAEIEQQLSADPADMKAVLEFVRSHALTVVDQSSEKRTVRVTGTLQQMNAAFGTHLAYVVGTGGSRFLSYDGPLKVPATVSHAITAVLGLHREPIASPR